MPGSFNLKINEIEATYLKSEVVIDEKVGLRARRRRYRPLRASKRLNPIKK